MVLLFHNDFVSLSARVIQLPQFNVGSNLFQDIVYADLPCGISSLVQS